MFLNLVIAVSFFVFGVLFGRTNKKKAETVTEKLGIAVGPVADIVEPVVEVAKERIDAAIARARTRKGV